MIFVLSALNTNSVRLIGVFKTCRSAKIYAANHRKKKSEEWVIEAFNFNNDKVIKTYIKINGKWREAESGIYKYEKWFYYS